MIKSIVCVCMLLALSQAAPQGQLGQTTPIPILRADTLVNPDGSYSYNYESGNGIIAQEEGFLKNAGNPETEAQSAQGSFSYTGPDGVAYSVNYVADENGFRAEGQHLPTDAPLSPELQRALELIESLANDGDDGQYRPEANEQGSRQQQSFRGRK